VSVDEPGAVDRLDHVAEAVTGLRGYFATGESLAVLLDRVAANAAMIIEDAAAVTITVLQPGGKSYTGAATDDRYLDIDRQQYASGRGPCLNAARTLEPVRASTVEHRGLWPEFCVAAEQVGVEAYLSMPLVLAVVRREPELVGSMNLYSHDSQGFGRIDEALMRVFSVAATQAIDSARRMRQAHEQVHNLEIALDSRAEIDQAKGILMAVHQCPASEAFDKLVEQSQRRNVKLRQVAIELIARATHPAD
jgi:GAF domain-containing protein